MGVVDNINSFNKFKLTGKYFQFTLSLRIVGAYSLSYIQFTHFNSLEAIEKVLAQICQDIWPVRIGIVL